jgi:hypothetical protein
MDFTTSLNWMKSTGLVLYQLACRAQERSTSCSARAVVRTTTRIVLSREGRLPLFEHLAAVLAR